MPSPTVKRWMRNQQAMPNDALVDGRRSYLMDRDRSILLAPTIPTYDPATDDYMTRLTAVGSGITGSGATSRINKIDAYLKGVRNNNITEILEIYFLDFADNLAGTLVKGRHAIGSPSTLTNSGVVAGDYSLGSGVNFGSPKHFKTGFVPNNYLGVSNAHLSVRLDNVLLTGVSYAFGFVNPPGLFHIETNGGSDIRGSITGDYNPSQFAVTTGSIDTGGFRASGYVFLESLASNDLKLYINGTERGSSTTVRGGNLTTSELWLGGVNNNGSGGFLSGRVRFATVGTALGNTKRAIHDALVAELLA